MFAKMYRGITVGVCGPVLPVTNFLPPVVGDQSSSKTERSYVSSPTFHFLFNSWYNFATEVQVQGEYRFAAYEGEIEGFFVS